MVRRAREDGLHVLAHIHLLQALVALVYDEVLDLVQLKLSAVDEAKAPSWSAHDDVGFLLGEDLLVLLNGDTAVELWVWIWGGVVRSFDRSMHACINTHVQYTRSKGDWLS